MKVVFSNKLRRVLQDPQASAKLRQFIVTASVNQPSQVKIELYDEQHPSVSYQPRLLSTSTSAPLMLKGRGLFVYRDSLWLRSQ